MDVGLLYFCFFGSWHDLEFGNFRLAILRIWDFFLLVLDFGFGIFGHCCYLLRVAAVPKGVVSLLKGERVA